MSKTNPAVSTSHVEKLRALCALSNIAEPVDFGYLVSYVKDAPDPETAVQGVLNRLSLSSDVLTRKWRGVITDLWVHNHPHVPLLPQLSLSADEVAEAPVLRDAAALIKALETEPVQLVEEQHEWLIEPADAVRVAKLLPSRQGQTTPAIESEWSIMSLRRLRSTLQAVRLVRPMKGKLVPVRSRVKRFRALPPAQQFFILWHADAYHVDWTIFAGLWEKYMQVVQEYLPLLWETSNEVEAGSVADRAEWAMSVLETFSPLWEDEGLLDVRPGQRAALHIVQQHALPTIIDRFLLRDLLERHGLVTITEEFGSISKFTWTALGAKVVAAEASQELPCGNELLSPSSRQDPEPPHIHAL